MVSSFADVGTTTEKMIKKEKERERKRDRGKDMLSDVLLEKYQVTQSL